jgi:hypothetical protein
MSGIWFGMNLIRKPGIATKKEWMILPLIRVFLDQMEGVLDEVSTRDFVIEVTTKLLCRKNTAAYPP